MAQNRGIGHIAFVSDTRRRSELLSESEIFLKPVVVGSAASAAQQHSPRPVQGSNPRLPPLTTGRGSIIQRRLKGDKRLYLLPPASPQTPPERLNTGNSKFLSITSPLITPSSSRTVTSKGSSPGGQIGMGSPYSPANDDVMRRYDVINNSDGAKLLQGLRKAPPKNAVLRRNRSHNSLEAQRVMRTEVEAGSQVKGSKFDASPGAVGTRFRDIKRFPSSSTPFDESWEEDRFFPIRRRKSSNLLGGEDAGTKLYDERRRHSSIVSISLPNVVRTMLIAQGPKPKDQRSKVKQNSLSSRNTSSTSDDLTFPRIRSRETPIAKDSSSTTTDSSNLKLPVLVQGTSPIHRRMRLGYLSHQFIREMKARRRGRPKRKSSSVMNVVPPIETFKKIARIVRLLLRCLTNYRTVAIVSSSSQMPFSMFSSNLTSIRTYPGGLQFDPEDYKATKESQISPELRRVMTLAPSLRTEKELDFALKSLRVLAEEFGDFPSRMQESLVRVSWMDEFEEKRVIIRQGQPAENFYFIISGTALVTKNRIDPKTGELFAETLTMLKRGMSFGELAIVRQETRNANVISNSSIALLTVARTDFIDIFMHRMDGEEPEFISFLRKTPEFSMFPLQQIPRNKPRICAFTFFSVGVVICDERTISDVIVIVKSGFCKVIKALKRPVKPRPHNGLTEVNFKTPYSTPRGKTGADPFSEVLERYSEWKFSHPISNETVRLLTEEDYTIKNEGKRLSLIDVENIGEPENTRFNRNDDRIEDDTKRDRVKDLVYIHVQTLKEGDVFGLLPLLFEPSEGATAMSLVSDGAECILINKNFYLKNLDAEMRENLIRRLRPYPTEERLQETMQEKCNWDAYKTQTVEAFFGEKNAYLPKRKRLRNFRA